jgi:ABC-2 type transport system ATP-binding protein
VSTPAIRLSGLTKYHGPVIGVEDLSLDVEAGEVFGFLGANGAGKTTTIRLMLDLLRPTRGTAVVLGYDCRRDAFEARRRIGYLPGEMPIYPELTGVQYLALLARLAVRPEPSRFERLVRRFNVSDLDLRRRMRDYSQGMKRKLGVIQALMTGAPVLILDEPTSGLDPLMIEALAGTLDELRAEGRTTVFLSSHVLSEVERTCGRIGLISKGRLVAIRTIHEPRAASPRRVTVVFASCVNDEPPTIPGAVFVGRQPRQWVVDVTGPLGDLVGRLSHLPVADVDVAPFALGDAVLGLYGEGPPC